MFRIIKNTIAVLALASAMLVPAVIPAGLVSAADIKNNLCTGAEIGVPGANDNCSKTTTSSAGVQTAATNIINLLSWVVGVISVIMIIIAGFRYITSGGASEKVTGAKNTLIYAIIGLVIVALAQFIVRFVLKQTIDATK